MSGATIVWLDLETCGLNPHIHPILECAAIATDDDLVEVGRFHRTLATAQWMHEDDCDFRALEMHRASGLWAESLEASGSAWTGEMDLSFQLRDWIELVCKRPLLAGNSVHFDRDFLKLRCTQAEAALHYRNLDVTTLHECARRWWPEAHCRPVDAKVAHRAMADAEMSLTNARSYREAFRNASIIRA